MNRIYSFIIEHIIFILWVTLLVVMFGARIYNLNYNSPFNDEAVYIVVGELGLFEGDWVTYNPGSWIAGHPKLYPSMAALGFQFGGIWGARFLSTLFGLVPPAIAGWMILSMYEKKSKWVRAAGMALVMSLVGGTAVGIYISRLATYDAPSVAFLMISVGALFKTRNYTSGIDASKWYVLAGISLAMAVMTKIIMLAYAPLVVFYAAWLAYQKHLYRFGILYFALPLATILGVYALLYGGAVTGYLDGQTGRENFNIFAVWSYFIGNTEMLTGFWMLGSLGLLLTRRWKPFFVLGIAGAWIVALHIATHRIASFDKHSYLAVIFWSIAAAIGITELLLQVPKRVVRPFFSGMLIGVSMLYLVIAYRQSSRFNNEWPNVDGILNALIQRMNEDDRVLTQLGGATILAVSTVTHPAQTTTFDWFEYQSREGTEAYRKAVEDGYFQWIVLDNQPYENNQAIYDAVNEHLQENYVLATEVNEFRLYARAY